MNSYSEKVLDALHAGDLVETQLMLTEALRNDAPENLEDLGEQLLQLGFLEEAQTIFQKLLEDHPETDGLNIPLAEIAIENNEIDQAFAYLEAISKDSLAYPESLLVLADLYQVLGIPEVSERKLKEAQTLLPDEPLLDFALAELYYTSGNLQEALRLYIKLLEQGEDETFPGVNLSERVGSTYSMMANFEEAIPYLEAAVEEGQTDDSLFQLGFTYLQIHENEKAISLLQQLKALNPTYQSLYLPLATALQEEELLEEAEEVLRDGVSENPYNVELYQLASEIAYRLHKVAESEALLRKAISLEEDKESSILTLSNLLLTEERYEEALTLLAEIEDEQNAYVAWNLALAHNALENFDEARGHYEKAAPELMTEPDFLKEYGLFLREEGQISRASEILSLYLEQVPGDIEVLALLED